MIAALLSWTKLPQWVLELIVIAAVALGVWYWQHERYESGITAQQQLDASSTAKLIQQTYQQTAALQAQATTATQAYVQEHQANIDYQRDNPPGVVRLCNAPATGSRGAVPESSTFKPGTANASAGTAAIPAVPERNYGSGEGNAGVNIGPMLSSLAAKCDEVAAVLREFQRR